MSCQEQRVTRVGIINDFDVTTIPVVENTSVDRPAVKVEQRTDGIADITCIADVLSVAEWQGRDVINELSLADEDGNPLQMQIFAKQRGEPESAYTVVYSGWVRKIGANDDSRGLRIKGGDWASIVDKMPAAKEFSGTPVGGVIQWAVDKMQDNDMLPPINPVIRADESDQALAPPETVDIGETGGGSPRQDATTNTSEGEPLISIQTEAAAEKTFSVTESVADVLNWVCEKQDLIWYFKPTGRGRDLQFVVADRVNHDTQFAGGGSNADVTVLENTVLRELNPLNTVKVIGNKSAAFGVREEGSDEVVIKRRHFAGLGQHRGLLNASGQQENTEVVKRSVNSPNEAKNVAKKILKQKLRKIQDGEIIVNGNPNMFPLYQLLAPEVCNTYIEANPVSQLYEMQKVTHMLQATGPYTTVLDVSVSTQPNLIRGSAGYVDGAGDTLSGLVESDEELVEDSVSATSGTNNL